MLSVKRLRSVTHSIAHHSASFLSYLHPELFHVARTLAISEPVVDLKSSDPCPKAFRKSVALRTAFKNLQRTFLKILSAENGDFNQLESAVLKFSRFSADGTWLDCTATLALKGEKELSVTVDSVGRVRKRRVQ